MGFTGQVFSSAPPVLLGQELILLCLRFLVC